MKTRLTALAAAVSSLSMLTACGGGGGSGEVPEFTPAYVPKWSNAEGMWDGVMASGRALSGVVTDGGESWLVYSTVADSSIPAGFYFGSASSVTVSSTEGSYAPASPNELEFNFEGGGKKTGGLAAEYNITDGYSSSNHLNGELVELPASGTIFNVTMQANVFFPTAQGNLIMEGFAGTWDSNTNAGFWHGTTSIPGFATTLWYDQTFTMNEATGTGILNTLFNCGANTVSACAGFSGALQGTYRNTQGAGAPLENNSYKKAYVFTPTDGGTYQWTLQISKPTGELDENDNPISQYSPMPMEVTLHALPPSDSIAADTFTTNYDDLYEVTPSLAAIAGSYTAAPAYTGIGSTMRTNTATFSISSGGAISGAESVTGCAYSGTIAARTKGNVYNVTGLTFSGGSCPYTSSGTFAGVAVYDEGGLVLTAKNSASDAGFLVIVSKP